MGEWDRYSCCGGFTDDGHAPGCHWEEAYVNSQMHQPAAHRSCESSGRHARADRYMYRGRIYEVVVKSGSYYGPVTLETVDGEKDTIETYNNRLGYYPFEKA